MPFRNVIYVVLPFRMIFELMFRGSSEIAQRVVDASLLFLKCGMNFELFENDEDNVGHYWIGKWAVIKFGLTTYLQSIVNSTI